MNIFNSYVEHLAKTPERIDSLLMWFVVTFACWIAIFVYRKEIITGLKGTNLLFESAEIITFLTCILFPPVVAYSAFFKAELPVWVWWFMSSIVAFQMGGRWIFEWVLALRAGATTVTDTETKKQTITTEVKTESKTE